MLLVMIDRKLRANLPLIYLGSLIQIYCGLLVWSSLIVDPGKFGPTLDVAGAFYRIIDRDTAQPVLSEIVVELSHH